MSYQAGDKVKIIGPSTEGQNRYFGREGVVHEVACSPGNERVDVGDLLVCFPFSSLQPVLAFAIGSRVSVRIPDHETRTLRVKDCTFETTITAIYRADSYEPGTDMANVYRLADGSLHSAAELELLPEPRTPKAGEVWEVKGRPCYMVTALSGLHPITLGTHELYQMQFCSDSLPKWTFLAESLAAYFAQVSK